MNLLKKYLGVCLLTLVVYLLFFIAHIPKSQQTAAVLGANSNLVLFTQPQDGRQPLLTEINNAQKDILVEMYLLTDKQIIASLIQAKDRGVDVEVLLEKHPFQAGNSNQTAFSDLQNDNVFVNWTNPTFALTHEKSLVIDDREVFILNQNLTSASFSKNREYDVLDTNPIDVAQAKAIFLSDKKRQTPQLVASSIVVSPDNSRNTLSQLISQATGHIAIEMEVLDDQEIVSVLLQKAQTIPIEVITPDISTVSSNSTPLHELQKAGVQVKTIKKPYLHAKLLLTDKNAYVGSINFSQDSIDHNRELGIIITQPDILSQLSNDFDTDWNYATDLTNN